MSDDDLVELPWSREAEQSVLGALLLDCAAIDRISLEPRHFFDHRHGVVFRAIVELTSANKPADVVTVFERLQSYGLDEECGGIQYLNALAQSVPSAANIGRYAAIVREKHGERALIETVDAALTKAKDTSIGVAERLDAILSELMALQRQAVRKVPRLLSDILVERLDHLQAVSAGEVPPAWPTQFPDINRRLGGGLRPGYTYVLAARPSIGKSSLAQAIGLYMAGTDFPTLFLSQEMPDADLGDRALVSMGSIDYTRFQAGELQNDEWGRLTEAMERGARLPFYVDDEPGLRPADIRAKARQVPGLKLIVLDYLQLSRAGQRGDNRNTQIEEISRDLKELAKEMGVAIIILSQLNRAVEGRADKRPTMADLRDSGAIEQDADVVMLMWRHRDFSDRHIIGMLVEKVRNGKIGEVALDFVGATQRWNSSTADLTPDPIVARGRPDL